MTEPTTRPIYARPGASYKARCYGPAGLVGTIAFTVYDEDGAVVTATSTTGITEPRPGYYIAVRAAPSPASETTYIVEFSNGAKRSRPEELVVNAAGAPPAGGGTTYAELVDVRDYTALADGISDEDLERDLRAGERDVDAQLRDPGSRDEATGLKYTPSDLEDYRAAQLNRAVCAQTEYRLEMGPTFFVRDQHASTRGPEFAVTGTLCRIGPKVRTELAGARLLRPRGIGSIGMRIYP